MAYKISKEDMIKELQQGKSLRQIGREYDISKSMIQYIAKQYDVKSSWSLKVEKNREDESFNVIDSKEKAFILGFILGDGGIHKTDLVNVSQSMANKSVIEWMAGYLNTEIHYDFKLDPNIRKYPSVYFNRKIKYIDRYLGSGLKVDRFFPRVPIKLEAYLLRGLFEADGCITGGIHKTKQHFWARLTISHHKKCLDGVQKFLYNKLNVSSIVRHREKEHHYILEISRFEDICKVADFMYADVDFMPTQKKYDKYIAVRLESDKFRERKMNPLLNPEPITK